MADKHTDIRKVLKLKFLIICWEPGSWAFQFPIHNLWNGLTYNRHFSVLSVPTHCNVVGFKLSHHLASYNSQSLPGKD